MDIVRAEDLCKTYGKGENQVKAVDHLNLCVEEGEFLAVVGSSGSGKSTLLHLLGGLDTPTSGKIMIKQTTYSTLKEDELAIFRRRYIGFVFQAYNLIQSINVWENITLPLTLDRRKIDKNYVNEIVQTVGLNDLLTRLPATLSGGQQQRVAIARALVAKPELVLADEPTGNLDSKTAQEVVTLLKASMRKFGQTLCLITHDERIAQMADRIIHMEDGHILSAGGDLHV